MNHPDLGGISRQVGQMFPNEGLVLPDRARHLVPIRNVIAEEKQNKHL
jgi:hypothetical protein